MDWANIFLFGLISSVIGAAILLLIQYYVFVKCFHSNENSDDTQDEIKNCVLPDVSTYNLHTYILGILYFGNNLFFLLYSMQNLLFDIHSPSPESKNCTMALNLIFQFLFYELRNTTRVKKWFYRKLSVELDQLSKTTTGKLFEKISVSINIHLL